jgi:hypothetical protein
LPQPDSPTSAREWRARAALALVASAAAYVAVELAYRAYVYGSAAAFSIAKIESLAPLGVSGLTQAATADADLLYELKPNLDVIFKLASFRTSSQGLRDREYPLEKPPGAVRIAAVGDSFTMGSGVDIEDAFPKVLERGLSRSEARPIEVLDFGVGGYGLRQYVAVMKAKAIRWHPDLFLVGFCPNDVRDRPSREYQKSYQPLPIEHPSFLRPQFAFDLWHFTGARVLGALSHDDPSRAANSEDGEGGPAYVDEQLRRMKAFSRTSGVEIAMVYLGLTSEGAAEIRRSAEAAGIAFIDPSPRFEGRPPRSLWVHRRDAHPNAAAHRVFADAVAEAFHAGRLSLPR